MSVDLGSAYGEIVIDGDGAEAGVKKAKSSLSSLESLGKNVGMALGAAFVSAGVIIGGAMAGVVGSSVSMAADLEEQMDVIASVMSATGDEVSQLEDLILDLGINPNLKVSTLEAAEAIEMLGRNGLTTAQIMEGAAEATVLLANATGAEFGTAANIATDAMSLFNVQAGDMIGAADLITAVVTNSKFSIEDFQLALAQGGGVASTLGLTLEEFTTVIAGIAPSFASGSDAGTSFKTMLQRLTAPTDQAKALMNQLGIEVFDAEGNMKSMAEITGMLETALYGVSEATVEVGGRTQAQNDELARLQAIYDRTVVSIRDYESGIKGASLSEEARARKLEDLRAVLGNVAGEMGPLMDISGQLTTVTKQLTEEERAQALTMLFGADAIRAASALAELGVEGFENLAAAMGDTSAADMAAQRMDNLKGKIEIVEGVIETLKIKIGNAFLPILTRLAEKVGEFLEQNGDRFVAFFEKAATFVGTFIDTLLNGEDPITGFFDALTAVGIPQETIDGIREVVDTVTDLVVQVVAFVSEHSEAFKGALMGIGAVLLASGIIAGIATVAGVIASLANPITLIIGAAALLGAAWSENWGGIRDITEEVIGEIKRSVEGGLTPLETIGEVLDNFIPEETMTKIWDFLLTLQDFASYFGEVAEGGSAVNDSLTKLPEAIQPLAELFGEALAEVRKVVLDIVPFFEKEMGKISEWFEDNKPLIQEFLKQLAAFAAFLIGVWAASWAVAIREVARFWEVVKPIISGLIDLVLGIATTIMQVATGDWAGAWETIKQTAVNVWTAVNEAANAFADWIAGWFGTTWAEISNTWAGIWDQFVTIIATVWELIKTTLAEKLTEIIQGILEFFISINEKWNSFWTSIRDFVASVWEGIKTAIMDAIVGLFESMGLSFDEMKARWSQIWSDVLFILQTVWNNIVTAVTEKIQEVMTNIQTKVDEIKTSWDEKWDAVKTKVSEIWESIVSLVAEKIEAVKSDLTSKTDEAKSSWEEKWDAIKTKVDDILETILTAVGEKLDEVKAKFEEKMEEARVAVDGFIEDFKTVGSNIVQGLIDGILSMAGSLITTLTGLAEDAIAAAMGALQESSPSKRFDDIGRWSIEGWINGVIGMGAKLADTMYRAGHATAGAFAEGLGRASSLVSAAVNGIGRGASESLATALATSGFRSIDPTSSQVLRIGQLHTIAAAAGSAEAEALSAAAAGTSLSTSPPRKLPMGSDGCDKKCGNTFNQYIYTDQVTAESLVGSYGSLKAMLGAI